jgi:hypothetical protein
MSDINPHRLHRIFAVVGRPGYCKIASEVVGDACPDRGYADLARHRYPCHTKEAAFASAMLACEDRLNGEDLHPHVRTELAKFAHFWGIESDVQAGEVKLAQAHRQVPVTELPDSDFALVQMHKDQKVRKYASFDATSTYDSAIAFYENRHRYPLAWRKTAAQQLLWRAEHFGQGLPEYCSQYLHKAAGYAIPSEDAIETAIVQRLNLSDREDTVKLAEALNGLAEDPEARYEHNLVEEIVRLMDQHDRDHKIATHYGSRLGLPEEILGWTISQMEKVAAQQAHWVTLTNGHEVDVTEIPAAILAAVDLEGASCQKLAEVLPTLPVPDANLLTRLLPKVAAMPNPTGLDFSNAGGAGAPAMGPASMTPTTSPSPKVDSFNTASNDVMAQLDKPGGPNGTAGNTLTDANFSQQTQGMGANPTATSAGASGSQPPLATNIGPNGVMPEGQYSMGGQNVNLGTPTAPTAPTQPAGATASASPTASQTAAPAMPASTVGQPAGTGMTPPSTPAPGSTMGSSMSGTGMGGTTTSTTGTSSTPNKPM